MATLELLAACAFGLEAVARRELGALGLAAKACAPGKLLFRGELRDICRANLWLRSADRVLLRLGAFAATDFGELFDRTRELPWEEWIPPDGEFPVNGRSHKSQLSSVPACQKIVKKAIVERLRAAHRCEVLPETGPKVSVEVALLDDEATLTIDTTGPSLHKRGYRRLVGHTPLKETLAAALVQLSFWHGDRPLADPFCGSGTIAIEAALFGRNMAPGLTREFAAETWPSVPARLWSQARDEARQQVKPALPERIVATDVDAGQIELARRHALAAGVAEDIHFQQRDFAEFSSQREYGCVVTNPPYGDREGDRAEVAELYAQFPRVLRRLPTWSHFILTSHSDFETIVGRKADRRRKLYNARIECTFYQFHGPKRPKLLPAVASPESGGELDIASETLTAATEPEVVDVSSLVDRKATFAPVFGEPAQTSLEQAELFRRRLTKKARHLRRWPQRGISCYRLYERDIPEIPLAVDRYENFLHISEYERPHDRSPAEQADWLDLMRRTAGEVMGLPPTNVFLKTRRRQRGNSQYEKVGQKHAEFVVHEGGLRFQINLSDYLDTGLFLDHRQTRAMVRDEASGKRFLNLFCYTGAFTVYAAAGGAESTTSVDLSHTYLDWAKTNLSLNGISLARHQFIREDAASYLQTLPPRPLFDLAVVDVPTFSNSKRLPGVWDVQQDHAALLSELMLRMSAEGIVYFSSNSRRLKLDQENIKGADVREITNRTVPPDFDRRKPHRCWRLRRNG